MNLQLSDKIMLLQPINIVYHKNASITIVLGAMVMLLLFSSCSGKKKELGDAITERDSMAVMDTRGVTTLVSDSGVTRYRINTEEWLVFDRKNPPYWAFEKGVYLEKFDSIFQVEASITCETYGIRSCFYTGSHKRYLHIIKADFHLCISPLPFIN